MKRIFILIILCLFLTACAKSQDNKNMFKNIREPAVAGQFYPAEAGQLKKDIDKYLAKATSTSTVDEEIKAIMVPHAGYNYSASVAAYAYKRLQGKKFERVILISNSHTSYFDGLAIDANDAWQTPLGLVEVDKQFADQLMKTESEFKYDSAAHASDHVLEIQLPFLQTVLEPGFKIIPILFGNTGEENYKKLAQALKANLGENDLIVISTDMSHYPKYDDANKVDQGTLAKIKTGMLDEVLKYINEVEKKSYANEQTLICGADGVKTILELYKLLGWNKIEVLQYANSGDAVIGDKDRVVGYGAVVFSSQKSEVRSQKDDKMLNKEQQEKLLEIARETVESYVVSGKAPKFDVSDERLNLKQGAFVTIKKNGELRGCIGQIIPTEKPLWQVVRDMAIAAASQDTRFQPVAKDELDELDYEISVLSVPETIDDWQKIELGKHGVIIKKGWQSGVFLPQVATETGWSLEEFLSELCSQKAGLVPDCYKNSDVKIEIFTAQVF